MTPSDRKIIRIVLAVVWLVTGALSFYAQQDSLTLLARVGLHGSLAMVALYLAASLDLLLGLLCLTKDNRALCLFQAALILAYTIVIALKLPEYLLHPFGPILKNLPILLLLWLLYKNENPAR